MSAATADVDAPRSPATGPPIPAAFGYLDVGLVVLALPVVALAGGPLLGYGIAAAAWVLQRATAAAIDRYARATPNPRTGLIAALAGLFLRLWLITLAVVVASRVGEREDALTAAILFAVAFTVYLAIQLLMRPQALRAARRAREER